MNENFCGEWAVASPPLLASSPGVLVVRLTARRSTPMSSVSFSTITSTTDLQLGTMPLLGTVHHAPRDSVNWYDAIESSELAALLGRAMVLYPIVSSQHEDKQYGRS